MENTATIRPEMLVNEVSQAFPTTLPVFHGAGIDSCCGGSLPVMEAASRHGIDLDWLMAELRRAADDSTE
jgi:iron-sulfur cluster repair protein YtfE (RIC family)